MNKDIYKKIYKKIFFIRNFEKLLLELFDKGILFGTTHTCIGQEYVGASILNDIDKNDFVISNHRCHGHFLSYSDEIDKFFKELIGDKNGLCNGIAGSQHIFFKNFISNGVLGNLLPVGSGVAMSNKLKKNNNIVFIFLGDGTFGEGIVYEVLNFCSIFKLRCLFIVENNNIAQSTKIEDNFSGSFLKRFEAFDINADHLKPDSIEDFFNYTQELKKKIRSTDEPRGLIVDVSRLAAHSKGDDTRGKEEISKLYKHDIFHNFKKKFDSDFIKQQNDITLSFLNNLLKNNKIDHKYEIR